MKQKLYFLEIILLIFLTSWVNSLSQTKNVGIGTNTPDNSAILHLDVSDNTAFPTKRGLLIPIMSDVQRDAIVTPATGLLVFVSTDNNFYFNSGTSGVPVWTVLLNGLNGILPISKGGTGLGTTPLNGQILIGNGTGYTLNTLTGGTGINIDNSVAGSITISATASAIDHNALLNVQLAGAGITYGHINDQPQTIAGVKTFSSQIVSTVADGTAPFSITSTTRVPNLNADMVDGKHASDFIANGGPAGGDLSGTYPDPTVIKIQGNPVISGIPNDGQILRWKASNNQWEYYGPLGIVTSVTVNLPSEFTMTGNGTSGDVVIGGTWNVQSPNKVFAGPVSGVDAIPSFRLLDATDIPNLSTDKLTTGTLPIARGGTGLGTTPTAGQILIGNGTDYSLKTLTAGTGITINSDATTVTIASTVSGTVTSVGLALPTEFTITNSPITGSGTLTGSWANQSANTVFAGPPVSGTAVPTFRSLVENDLPTISVIKLTGELPVVKGGTGVATLTGMLKGNGTSNITGITNTANNVTFWSDNNTIGGDSKVTWNGSKFYIDGDLEVTGTIDPKAVIYEPQGSAPSVAEGALYYDAATDKLKIITGSGTETILTGSLGAASGDISGTYPALTVVGLQGKSVSNTPPTNGQILKYSGTEWAPADPSGSAETDPVVKAITGIVKSNGTTISAAVAGTDYLAPFGSQSANTFYAAPSSAAGLPSFRIMDATDIPNLDAAKITSGTLPVDRGGTGATTLTGMLKGNGTSAISGVTNTAGNMTYWSDANTISGDANLTWDSGIKKFKVIGNSESITSTLTPQSTAPTGTEGSLYYNDTEKSLKVHDGTSWNNVGTGNLVVMSAYLDANQDLNNNNWTLIKFTIKEFDPHIAYNVTTGEFTAPVTGYYQVNSNIKATMSDGASYYLEIAIYINGSIYSEGSIARGNNSDDRASANISNLIKLTSGDKITLYTKAHYTLTPQAIGSASKPYVTYLTIHQVK